MPHMGRYSIISIGICFFASQPSQLVGVCVTSQRISLWECRVVCDGFQLAWWRSCSWIVDIWLGGDYETCWFCEDNQLSGQIAAQTTMELGNVKGLGWEWCANVSPWETQQQTRRGGAWAALFSLIILSWIIRWTHFCSAFIRCTEPNPIGYQPNLQPKPCCLHSQLWWGH